MAMRGGTQTHLTLRLPRCHRYNLRIRLYRPRSASLLQTFLCWLSGMPAEFADGRFPAAGAGREGVWWLGSC